MNVRFDIRQASLAERAVRGEVTDRMLIARSRHLQAVLDEIVAHLTVIARNWLEPSTGRRIPGMSGRGPCDGRISEFHGRSDHVVELLRETVAELLFRPPRGPPLLADIAVPGEDLGQRPQFHMAMPCHLVDGVAQLGAVDGVAPGEQVHVGEVPPPCVYRSPSDSGHDLLGVDHGERVPSCGDLPAQQPRDADLLGWRDDRVASADIDVEVGASSAVIVTRTPG